MPTHKFWKSFQQIFRLLIYLFVYLFLFFKLDQTVTFHEYLIEANLG
jgi:hypothetical protein